MNIRDIKRISEDGCPKLQTIGWLPAHRVDLKLVSFNINFSVQVDVEPGRHSYFYANGKEVDASFPQLQIWHPGRQYEYRYEGMIESLYFGYEEQYASWVEELLRNAGVGLETEFVALRLTTPIYDLMRDIRHLIDHIHERGNIDRLDLMVNRLLLECLLNTKKGDEDLMMEGDVSHKIRAIASEIDCSYLNFDLDDVLKKHGLGKRTFFRHWSKIYSITPHQYLLKCKLDQARILLDESQLSVKDIAMRAGFVDTFHFSKCFKRFYGLAPSQFRLKR